VRLEQKKFETAEEELRVAASTVLMTYGKLCAQWGDIRRVHARMLLGLGEYDKALELLSEALAIDAGKDWAQPFLEGDYARPGITCTIAVRPPTQRSHPLEFLKRIANRGDAPPPPLRPPPSLPY